MAERWKDVMKTIRARWDGAVMEFAHHLFAWNTNLYIQII